MGKKIAFIGLGHMGGPIAANLIRAGHRVSGSDLAPEALDQARAQGIEVAMSAAAAATGVQARLGTLAEEIYRHFAEIEGAARDFSGTINEIRANSCVEVPA